MKKFCFSIMLLFITDLNAYALCEIEVIPYKISNPHDSFTIKSGKEYAKLILIAAFINKKIIAYPRQKVNEALNELSLNPQKTITEDDLILIGKIGRADYILTGTLSKSKESYTSHSILYSIRNRRIMSKSHVTSSNLMDLAEKEMNNIFFQFPNRRRKLKQNHVDVTLLIDLSFNVSNEWPSIKNSIISYANSISANWSVDTKINIVPFSDKYNLSHKQLDITSISSLNKKLKRLKPSGTKSAANFENALSYAVRDIPWRRKADRILILFSNSKKIEGKFFEKHALTAKNKKITVYTISLGSLKKETEEPLRQFSIVSKGLHTSVTYHQRLYNKSGNPIDIFYEGGRLFHSLVYNNEWQDGLFENTKENKFSSWKKPKSFLKELIFDEKEFKINPYNMNKYYHRITDSKIINTTKLENNIESILRYFGDTFVYSAGKLTHKKPIAKALLTDGEISIWIKIKQRDMLEFFQKKESTNHLFQLGVIIQKNSNEPHGISFYPDYYITDITSENSPKMIKTDLNKIINNPNYFINNGLLNPPVWFIEVKAARIEKYKKIKDIRE